MADNDLHFFTATGKETSEGSTDSVVQYTEADATERGLKFKASDYKPAEPISMDDRMKVAAEDGSTRVVKPVTVEALTEPARKK